MVCRLVVVSLFLAATAYAQAPGEVAPAPAGAQPMPSPCACGGYESVMANRWAVGLSVGSLGLTPKDAPDDKSSFGVGELSLRFRATLHLEVELQVGGGRQQLQNGDQGDLSVTTGVLGLRYRFAPEQRWNWWVMGGIGSLSVASQDATTMERDAVSRPIGELGVGIERRFHHFAIDAELRAIGVGEAKSETQPVTANIGTGTAAMTTPPPPPPSTSMSSSQLSGGQLTIGASYYF